MPVYGLILGLLFQIFIACLMGNFVELTVSFNLKKNTFKISNTSIWFNSRKKNSFRFQFKCWTRLFSKINFTKPLCFWTTIDCLGWSVACTYFWFRVRKHRLCSLSADWHRLTWRHVLRFVFGKKKHQNSLTSHEMISVNF